ncbi:DUF6095 family protein [Ascidiimonas sp. W6]|uniref:DUF6095 family protein n=1 Tax=Ascidiimonas meishanensis TaxID=3128903 RepID=UPI0030EC7DDA
MSTDRSLLFKSVKYFSITVFMMFTGPIVIYQAFKNQDHPFYWPVLIVGLLISLGAIAMGFYSLRTMMNALFAKNQ